MDGWEQLPAYQAEQSALILWATLEGQRDPGLSWGVLEAMEPHLRKLLPLQARNLTRRSSEGLMLRQLVRHFDPDKATAMLEAIGFTDLMLHLRDAGYEQTRETFIQRACSYARAEQSSAFYAR